MKSWIKAHGSIFGLLVVPIGYWLGYYVLNPVSVFVVFGIFAVIVATVRSRRERTNEAPRLDNNPRLR